MTRPWLYVPALKTLAGELGSATDATSDLEPSKPYFESIKWSPESSPDPSIADHLSSLPKTLANDVRSMAWHPPPPETDVHLHTPAIPPSPLFLHSSRNFRPHFINALQGSVNPKASLDLYPSLRRACVSLCYCCRKSMRRPEYWP